MTRQPCATRWSRPPIGWHCRACIGSLNAFVNAKRPSLAAHVALANRGSRLTVYDLRESLESAVAPLPVDFLAAREHHAWWRAHLADAFRAIVAREKVTRRHRLVKQIAKRSGATLEQLWPGRSGGSGRSGG